MIIGVVGVVIAAASISVSWWRPSLFSRNEFGWDRFATEGRLTRLISSAPSPGAPALSPDGTLLAFVTTDDRGQTDLYVTRVAGGSQLRLTEDQAFEQYPRFSPDGSEVLFTRLGPSSLESQLCVVSTLGGAARVIVNGAFGAWSPRGDRIAYTANVQPDGPVALFTSAIDGSDAKEILAPSSAYQFLRHPSWSRDGRQVAVVRGTGGVAGEIWLVPVNGDAPQRFTEPGSDVWSDTPVFTPDGRGIIYTSNRGGAANLWLQMFDGSRGIRLTTGPGPEGFPTVSDAGVIAFQSSKQQDELILHTMGSASTITLLKHAPFIWAPVFSPDQTEVTFSRSETDGSWHLWRVPLEGGTATQVTSGTHGELHPRYTTDGQSIVYHSWGTPRHIWRVSRDGGHPVQLTFGDYDDGFADVSPDGRWLVFARTSGVERVHIAPLAGGEARAVTQRPSSTPRWSPDGKLIAFSPTRGHNGGIFVVTPDGSGERRLTDIGGWPVWWPDGQQISYLRIGANRNQQIWTVPVAGGTPRLLESLTFNGYNYPFDISRDALRVLTSRATESVSREIWLLRPPSF
jgi:TolB protein